MPFPGQINEDFALVIMALALSMDAFSICLAIGMTKPRLRQIVKIGIVIGLFHVIMPFIGILIGEILSEHFKAIADIVGGMLLVVLGGQMIIDFFQKRNARIIPVQPKGIGLIIFALSLSLDSFSVGLSLGVYGAKMLVTIVIFGLVNLFLAWAGLLIGRKTHTFFGLYGEAIGGLILLVLGFRMLFQMHF
ncbi:manganese efflux pump MntP family protein [Terrilactibacillus sp. S3-3]|nr:manganese efflux pump MntP family protein [Terrilactibacillus sp. S3-3]